MKKLKDKRIKDGRNRKSNQESIERASIRFAELLISYLELNKAVKGSGLK